MRIDVLIHLLGGFVNEVYVYSDKDEAEDAYWQFWKDRDSIERGDDEAVDEACAHSDNFMVWHATEVEEAS
jgi:hypothetical protein